MNTKSAVKAAKQSVMLAIKAIEAAGFAAEAVRRCKSEARAKGMKKARELDLKQYDKAQKKQMKEWEKRHES